MSHLVSNKFCHPHQSQNHNEGPVTKRIRQAYVSTDGRGRRSSKFLAQIEAKVLFGEQTRRSKSFL